MSGPGEPPEGTPEGVPGGGDDEYRSVVFDESFVKAARIQEFSARERLDGATRAVRVRHVLPRGLARQAVALILLIVVAFGFAVYMGLRHPYQADSPPASEQLRVNVIPLVPIGPVPSVPAGSPFDGGLAEHYREGADGINPPAVHSVGGFTESEVNEGFLTAREYLIDSGLKPQTVTGGDVRAVRNLLDPGQLDQFDSSLTRPVADGRHEATGWLVRFDPAAKVRLVGDDIRVQGTLDAGETADNQLEITSDHTFVYAVRGPAATDGVSLFTVRRQLRFEFSHEDLRQHHIEVVQADVAAGPLACTSSVQGFRPILAGQTAPGTVAGADPYNHDHPVGAVCAPLTRGAPTVGGTRGGGAPGAGTDGSATPTVAASGPAASPASVNPASPGSPTAVWHRTGPAVPPSPSNPTL